jgi:Flp pilus assembly protein TadG
VEKQHGKPLKNKFITIGKNRSQGPYSHESSSFIIVQQEPNGPFAPKISMQVVDIIFNQLETVSIKLQAHAGAHWLTRSLTPRGDKKMPGVLGWLANIPGLGWLVRRMSRFGAANRANVALIFALAVLPLLLSVGVAIDYSRVAKVRSEMQSAVDGTSLMLAQDAANLSAAQLSSAATRYFTALFRDSDATSVAVTATYATSSAGATVLVSSTGNMPTIFMSIVGINTVAVGATSTATWGNTKLRVALALDNTGSMANAGKMAALQGGANNMIDQLSATASSNGDVYIAVVPFANEVNMGTSLKNSGYINWTNWSTYGSNEEGYVCGSSNQAPKNNKNGTMKCGTSNNSITNWNGCVMDRGNQSAPASTNDDTVSTAPGSGATLFPADQSSYCPQPVQALSYNWTQLKQTVTNMSPNGSTNQAVGLHHAWMTLLQSAPYSAPAESSSYNYSKAIILLSDGLNTQDRWYGDGYSTSTQVDDRQKILCDNIKATGITIYSIQVNTDGDPQSTVLAYCASGSANFFYLTSATEVLSTFSSIGTKLSKLRIAK